MARGLVRNPRRPCSAGFSSHRGGGGGRGQKSQTQVPSLCLGSWDTEREKAAGLTPVGPAAPHWLPQLASRALSPPPPPRCFALRPGLATLLMWPSLQYRWRANPQSLWGTARVKLSPGQGAFSHAYPHLNPVPVVRGWGPTASFRQPSRLVLTRRHPGELQAQGWQGARPSFREACLLILCLLEPISGVTNAQASHPPPDVLCFPEA